ncbi:MAG TPA: FKBP-type peptidyl-prolyl cis-trans isomerase [Acidimicrobiales bacterium]|nr:FKBP-type peptidyl-prolyl cis-trans isomerase [Acidimicrobiales bacterium]
MATSKRERQKAARREKIERQQRHEKRRKGIRRGVIVVIAAAIVVGIGAAVFTGNSTTTTTTTSTSTTTTTPPTTTTTVAVPTSFAPVSDPSPAGVFGKAPTVTVPAGAPPKVMELTNLITGTGAVARQNDTVELQYVLATYSTRKVIQSSWTSSPFSTDLTDSAVIPGFFDGVVGMRVGGRRELVIPPSLGYGDTSAGTGIAKNDTLVFVIDLLKVTK